MGLLTRPQVITWLALSVVILMLSIFMAAFLPNRPAVTVISIALSALASSILFPLLVGLAYERIKEKANGEAVWQVFREFADGGILRIYKDREEREYGENAVSELRRSFQSHRKGEVKLIGISLRVFFLSPGPFFESISGLIANADADSTMSVKVLLSDPASPEVANRSAIETPRGYEPTIAKEIALTSANIDNLRERYPKAVLNYNYYSSAPYCTLVVFPHKCFFSPNLLSISAPVRLPMIVFRSGSHGYKVLNEYFQYLWKEDQPDAGSPGRNCEQSGLSTEE